jgi:hypothetical protein
MLARMRRPRPHRWRPLSGSTPLALSGRALRALSSLLTAALLGLVLPGGARAGVASLLEWEAPAGCPGALDLRSRLQALLGYEPETLGKLSRVRGSLVRASRGYRLSLEVFEEGRTSSRLLESASCDELTDAAAIAIVLAMAPDAARSTAEIPESKGHEATRTPDEPRPAPSVTPKDPASTRAPWRGFAEAGAVVQLGPLPEAGAGLELAAGARSGSLALGGYAVLLGSEQVEVAPAQSVEFELLVAGARGCYAVRGASPRLDACAGFEAGRLRATGVGLSPSRRFSNAWIAPGVAASAEWPLAGSLALVLRADSALPLFRERYTVDESETVHAPAWWSARLSLGLCLLAE